jgi:hypothetical protein
MSTAHNWEGFYASYMTGTDGQGFAMFVFFNGLIVGTDVLGVSFDGNYSVKDTGDLVGEVSVKIPPNGTVIQGVTAGPSGMTYTVPVKFGVNDLDLDYVELSTPLGPINLVMKKMRGLEMGESGNVG